MNSFGRSFVLAVTVSLFTACGSGDDDSTKTNPTYELTSSKNSQDMFAKQGLPGSSKYTSAVADLNVNDFDPKSLSKKPNKKSDPKKKVTDNKTQPSKKVTSVADPWRSQETLKGEQIKLLLADFEQGMECLSMAREGEDTQSNLTKAAKLFIKSSLYNNNSHRATCMYNAACAYSLLNDNAKSVKFLKLSVKKFGFSDLNRMKTNSDLDNIRNDKGYKKIIAKLEKAKDVQVEEDLFTKIYREADALYDKKEFIKAAEKYLLCDKSEKYAKSALYNAACCYSLANQPEKAIECLKKAIEAGWDNPEKLKTDKDLDNLRKLEDFKKLLKK